MGVFQKKNVNRFRRVYPGIRKSPRYEDPVKVEAGYIDIVNDNSGSFNYTLDYNEIPSITATPVDTVGGGEVNVNLYISTVTKLAVEIKTSDNITGRIYLQVVGF